MLVSFMCLKFACPKDLRNVFDSDSRAFKDERPLLKARWIDVSSTRGSEKKIEFEVAASDKLRTEVIHSKRLKK